MVDVFGTVVGVKPRNSEGKLMQDGLQHRHEIQFADLAGAPHHLPLRHAVHGVDVIHPLGSLPIALMYRVDPQKSRTPLRIRFPAFPNGHRRRPRRFPHRRLFSVAHAVAQVV